MLAFINEGVVTNIMLRICGGTEYTRTEPDLGLAEPIYKKGKLSL